MIAFNLNDEVTVTLTEHGAGLWNDAHPPREQAAAGEHKAQLWDIMETFGEHVWDQNYNAVFATFCAVLHTEGEQ